MPEATQGCKERLEGSCWSRSCCAGSCSVARGSEAGLRKEVFWVGNLSVGGKDNNHEGYVVCKALTWVCTAGQLRKDSGKCGRCWCRRRRPRCFCTLRLVRRILQLVGWLRLHRPGHVPWANDICRQHRRTETHGDLIATDDFCDQALPTAPASETELAVCST